MILCVLAKEPRPGFVKTRLCPPCSPVQAATLAEACLRDTLACVVATPAVDRLVVLDGEPGPWIPAGTAVVPQPDGDFGSRLDAAVTAGFDRHPEGPVMVIGMDTPQVTPGDLAEVVALLDDGCDAVLGPATDGGYWVIGFRRLVPGAFDGVPMSTDETGAAQARRLEELGCRVGTAGTLTDVDDIASARSAAAAAPGSAFATALDEIARSSGW